MGKIILIDMAAPGAQSLAEKLAAQGGTPGAIIKLTADEFKALKNSLVQIEVPTDSDHGPIRSDPS